MNLFDIKDKVVVITGGTGVLGRSISYYLALQGAKIVILGRNTEMGSEIVSKIEADGGEVLFLASDVLDIEKLKANREDIINHFGRIDVLLNAAGGNMAGATITPNENIFDLELEAFRKVIDINFFGTVNPTTVFLEDMVKHGKGIIVNFCSESALRPLTRVMGYSAAKASIANYTKALATELAIKFGEGFRVNAITPGFFITEQNRNLLTNPDGTFTQRGEAVIAHTPFKRFGEAEELCGSIHYLISDASSFVTGSLLVVDGGFDSFSI